MNHFIPCLTKIFQEREVTEHQCILTAKVVTLKDDAGNINFYCVTCGSEFETEEESNNHVCQVVSVEQGISTEIFSGTNVLESMLGRGTTTIVLEQSADDLALDTIEEVNIPTGENVQVMVDGEQLRATLAQGATLEHVTTTESLAEILSGGEVCEPVHVEAAQYEHAHFEQDVAVKNEEGEGVEEEGAASVEMYMCGICSEIFQSREEIHLHLAVHAETEITEEGDVMETNPTDTLVESEEQEMLSVVMGDQLVESVEQETMEGTIQIEHTGASENVMEEL